MNETTYLLISIDETVLRDEILNILVAGRDTVSAPIPQDRFHGAYAVSDSLHSDIRGLFPSNKPEGARAITRRGD